MALAARSSPKVPSKLGQVLSILSQSALDFGSRLHKMPSMFTWPPQLKFFVPAPCLSFVTLKFKKQHNTRIYASKMYLAVITNSLVFTNFAIKISNLFILRGGVG